jgi:hypothetical protein
MQLGCLMATDGLNWKDGHPSAWANFFQGIVGEQGA